MSTTLASLINEFTGLHVLVLGDAMLDSYLEGYSNRLCREAPVPVVNLSERINVPGGAANTAVNVRSLGGQVSFVSVTGNDLEADLLRQALEKQGVSTKYLLSRSSRQTLSKHRVKAASQLLVRFDQGSTEPVDEETEQRLIAHLDELFLQCDAVIVSDYGYGILTPRIVQALNQFQTGTPRLLAVDSKNLATYRQVGISVAKPNYQEVVRLLGINPADNDQTRIEQIITMENRLFEMTGAQIAAVTLDTAGSLVFERNSPPHRTYARPSHPSQTAGAGDTFISAFTLALAAGAPTPVAAELASVAADTVVRQDGTSTCSADALRGSISIMGKYVTDLSDLEARLAFYRVQGQRIVFTNGCFDILHRGHITYLNRAKALGDILIVGLNSDESVRRLKGPNRPINNVDDRAQILAALSCIDHIVPFAENMPTRLIEQIKPMFYVKGGDYTPEILPEAPLVEALGGEVRILPYLEDFSTTSMIERIHNLYAWPPAAAEQAAVPSANS